MIPRVTWFVTHRCNLACDYCLTILPEQVTEELGPVGTSRIIDAICDLDPEVVILTGGEVTQRRDLRAILHQFSERDQDTVLVTNGTRGTKVLDIPHLRGISCSVDIEPSDVTWRHRTGAPDDRSHKSVTGAEVLIEAVARGFDATASVVAHRGNADDLPALIAWLSERGVASFVSVLHAGTEPGWRFRSRDTSEILTPEQAARLSVDLAVMHEQGFLILNDYGYLIGMAEHASALDWHCSVPSDLVVDSDGSILSCSDWWGDRCKRLTVFDREFTVEAWEEAWRADTAECSGCYWHCIYQAESGSSSRVPGGVGS